MIVSIILKYILISILIFLIFGVTVLSDKITEKVSWGKFISKYSFQLWSLLIFIIVWLFNKYKVQVFKFSNLADFRNIVLMLLAVIPTSLIVSLGNKSGTKKAFRLADFMDGASMEIPQRLLVQNMFVIFNINVTIYGRLTLAILLNSLIWAQFIIIQEFINGKKVTSKNIPEIVASVWFSIWDGILYSITGNIIAPMFTHGLERIMSYWMKQNLGKTKKEYSSVENNV